jgi:hypothetical protein
MLLVVILAAACTSLGPVGVFSTTAETSEGYREVRVNLKPDGAATVQAPHYFAEGKWSRVGNDRIVVELAGERPDRIVFTFGGDQLAGAQWNSASWGKAGPGVLYRVR